MLHFYTFNVCETREPNLCLLLCSNVRLLFTNGKNSQVDVGLLVFFNKYLKAKSSVTEHCFLYVQKCNQLFCNIKTFPEILKTWLLLIAERISGTLA